MTTVGDIYDDWRLTASRQQLSQVRPFAWEFENADPELITFSECVEWARDHPWSVRYLRAFFAWAGVESEFSRVPVKMHAKRPDPPSAECIERAAGLLHNPGSRAVLLAAYSGLRVGELCALEPRDVNRDEQTVRVRNGKGGVRRTAIVFPLAASALVEALHMAAIDGEDRLFPVSPATMSGWWRHVRDRAGCPEHTFHDLRHFHATWLLDQGAAPTDVAVQLHGHDDPSEIIRTYGHPDHGKALERLRRVTGDDYSQEVRDVGGDAGSVLGAASDGAGGGEPDPNVAGRVEAGHEGGPR